MLSGVEGRPWFQTISLPIERMDGELHEIFDFPFDPQTKPTAMKGKWKGEEKAGINLGGLEYVTLNSCPSKGMAIC